MEKDIQNLWGIILAGGEGIRLREFVKQIYGAYRPKQYCTFLGSKSMIQHTVSRVSRLIQREKLLMVVNTDHREYISEQFDSELEMNTIEQPCLRDTGVGILLPLTKINNREPDSTIAIFPSDHFIVEEDLFLEYVKLASHQVEKNPEKIIMLGIRPDKFETGYGWIELGDSIDNIGENKVFNVDGFKEKPNPYLTGILIKKGSLINTFVLIGKSKAFLKYYNTCLPQLVNAFNPIKQMIGTPYEKSTIRRFYKYLPAFNFSKCVLEKICDHLNAIEMKGVYWSDWGEEERIINDLGRFQNVYANEVFAT
jgi:mannose-1-phosphate guanylyltransferase